MAKTTVFTPARPVSDDMFATRSYQSLQDRVEGHLLEQGRQVVLFGLTGVGKTSLVGHLCRGRKIKYVRVECGAPFEDMMREVVGKVVREHEVERIDKESAELGVGATIAGIFKGSVKANIGAETKMQPYQVSLATAAAEAYRIKGVSVLFLDNFENLQAKPHFESTAVEIVQLMKSFSDRAAEVAKAPKVVVAGIPVASAALVQMDNATARRTAQVEVPRMAEGELDQILTRGEQKLGISFEGLLRDRIVQFSDGFPYYTHMFALHCARRAVKAKRKDVKIDDFDDSLSSILADCDLELTTAYENAVETTGKIQMRKGIIESLAVMNDIEVPFRKIRESFLKLHPEYESPEKLQFLSRAVTPLVGEHAVLARTGKAKSHNNRYRFENPLMRGYVRLRMHQELQQQLPV